MTPEEKQRMWDIDSKAQLNSKISQEDKDWFNEHYEEMKQEAFEEYHHWEYHSNLFNVTQ